jgi:hypothetical protein
MHIPARFRNSYQGVNIDELIGLINEKTAQ